eukprot:TRINITY_DN74191_c0_g1_i1.p1 TRINITY_DN74191_c0_g1~~TRINITY_DN74191_c0_g1_i1.p1  ORF type:complete len:382 (-),score=41.26 TRINITY_DN74191_c0_g1_i1:23-1078(-)
MAAEPVAPASEKKESATAKAPRPPSRRVIDAATAQQRRNATSFHKVVCLMVLPFALVMCLPNTAKIAFAAKHARFDLPPFLFHVMMVASHFTLWVLVPNALYLAAAFLQDKRLLDFGNTASGEAAYGALHTLTLMLLFGTWASLLVEPSLVLRPDFFDIPAEKSAEEVSQILFRVVWAPGSMLEGMHFIFFRNLQACQPLLLLADTLFVSHKVDVCTAWSEVVWIAKTLAAYACVVSVTSYVLRLPPYPFVQKVLDVGGAAGAIVALVVLCLFVFCVNSYSRALRRAAAGSTTTSWLRRLPMLLVFWCIVALFPLTPLLAKFQGVDPRALPWMATYQSSGSLSHSGSTAEL